MTPDEQTRRRAALDQVRGELATEADSRPKHTPPTTIALPDWSEPFRLFRRSSHPNPRVSRDRSGTEE